MMQERLQQLYERSLRLAGYLIAFLLYFALASMAEQNAVGTDIDNQTQRANTDSAHADPNQPLLRPLHRPY